ncbi:DUF2461 domain-containing protein [Solimonas sp. K1W22B-7]|uniref:DUF2461 domain-containing protein n=1 Tax=Solimonas sp. K1W22B-7 TaxID=2303331 RepID=UPI000E32F51E|nr:DUF2461 domain-containing protein [Solimonas sp. K1W22B-7]AXQ28171.1 DUF2461 domain-containing protein [Solimonas sp. K1W22B-7]
MAKQQACFTPDLFKFLKALKRNNSREWFQANKANYEEQVRGPALRLIADMEAPLRSLSPQIVANPKPVGGSLFRIHRDTRFATDKTPYKTHVGITFYHAATKAMQRGDAGSAAMGRLDAPVLYLHLEPGECFTGGGIWHPQPESLARIRNYLLNNPASWKQATRSAAFRKHWEMGGDSLSRPPKGYDPTHELIEDLKRKDFIGSTALSDEDILSPGLPQLLMKRYREVVPLCDWLCGALDLEF